MPHQDKGRVWLVTGAAGALGRELVRQLIEAGSDCIALDRDERGLNKLHDSLVEDGLAAPALVPLDLVGAGPEDYRQLAETVEAEFGRLDGIMHNAAVFTALRPLLHQPADEWFQTLQVGLTGPLLLTTTLVHLLPAAPEGQIVFIADRQCLDTPANWAAYGVVQAARRQMVATLKAEAGTRGPGIVEIDPGPFFSPLHTAAWPSASAAELPDASEAAARVLEATGR